MISLVGSWQSAVSSSAIQSITVTKTGTTSGNLLVLAMSYSGPTQPVITSTQGDLIQADDSSNTSGVSIFYMANIAGGDITIKADFGRFVSHGAISLALSEWSGASPSECLDAFQDQAQSSVTAFTSGTGVTPVNTNCLAIGIHTHNSTNTTTATGGSGYTLNVITETFSASATQPLAVEYQVLSGTPSTQAKFTTSSSDSGITMLATFFPPRVFNESFGLSATPAISDGSANLNVNASITLTETPSITASAVSSITPDPIALQATPALTASATKTTSGAIEFDATASMSIDATANYLASIGLTASPSISESATVTIPLSLSLSATAGSTMAASLGVNPAPIVLSATPGIGFSATVTMSAVMVLSAAPNMSSTFGFQSGDRGFSLNATPGIFFNAEVIPTTLVTCDDYLKLVTSEYNQQPKFMAMLCALIQGQIDNMNLLNSFSSLFDLDIAVGQQLDMIGLWVGISRNIVTPLVGVFFAWNTVGVGWNQGVWLGPNDSTNGLTTLDDSDYRILLKAKIAANHWDGTIPGAYRILAVVFALEGFNILIQDNQDMSMAVILLNTTVTAVALALLTNGYIVMRPAGVLITGYYQPTVDPTVQPLFGWGIENSTIAGWNHGAWVKKIG